MEPTNTSTGSIFRSIRTCAVAVSAAASLAGCAGMTQAECRDADWYGVGYADGDRYGLRPRIDQYAHQCRAFGVQASEEQYMRGWTDGYREWVSRVHANDCCAP